MLKIRENYIQNSVDFVLEDGTILCSRDWQTNENCYILESGSKYTPIFKQKPIIVDKKFCRYEVQGFNLSKEK